MRVDKLKVHNLENPIGIQTTKPVFSWKLDSKEKGKRQAAYRIVAASSEGNLKAGIYDKWDTGKVISSKHYGIMYEGKEVVSMERVYWSVMVWDAKEEEHAFKGTAFFEMGLLHRSDWVGKWVTKGANHANAPILSREFVIDANRKVKMARLYITGLGLFEAHINGAALSEETFFNPGESDARDTVYYCTYDIAVFLNKCNGGKNAVSVLLGNGQYTNYRIHRQSGRYYKIDDARGEAEVTGMFGDVKCLAQIVITYEDGEIQYIGTDDTWAYIDSPITENSWYGGEDYDATLEIDGWDDVNPAIPREQWEKAALVKAEEVPRGELVGVEFRPIRRQESETITAETIIVTKVREEAGKNTYLVDMGRNHAGVPEITIHTNLAGQVITMYPAEVDTFDGYQNHINQESCTQSASKHGDLIYDTYITKGSGAESYHPRFCYHGYRYLEVVAPKGLEITNGCFKGYVLRTDNAKNGSFVCSDEVLNQINTLTERSIESNMFSTFTDCPQIEKLGWLETPGLMFYSMSHTYDISTWIPKIIRDMVDSQYADGRIAAIAPEYFKINGLYEDLNWNGSVIFTAWQYYEAYGNAAIFSGTTYTAMKNYMDYLEHHVAEEYLVKAGQMSEWGEMTSYGTTPVILVETTSYFRLANCMKNIAEVIGNTADMEYYSRLAEEIKRAFHENKECYNSEHLYGNGTQSGYGCVLYSGIVLEEHVVETVERLVEAIRNTEYHLTSGEVGLKQVFHSLAEHDRSDIIYKMVTNDTMPSYKYFITKGLTALPEYWNFEDLWWGMARSRNHAMMGHVKEWFTKYLAGISLAEVGYDKVNIKPAIVDSVRKVKGTIDTLHGFITSEYWLDEDKNMTLKVSLPVGVHANVFVPILNKNQSVIVDGKEARTKLTADGAHMLLDREVTSGEYVIEVKAF